MRQYIDILRESAASTSKIDRSAFVYLPPKPPVDDFAQCATCVFFKPDSERCGIFGPDDKVTAQSSCGLYVHGEPDEDQACRSATTPKDAGLVNEPVRCENCSWYDGQCGLYKSLMKA